MYMKVQVFKNSCYIYMC